MWLYGWVASACGQNCLMLNIYLQYFLSSFPSYETELKLVREQAGAVTGMPHALKKICILYHLFCTTASVVCARELAIRRTKTHFTNT